MTPSIRALGLESLSPSERFALAQALWDTVHDSLAGEPIAPEVREELERRAALADADAERGIPWEEVRPAAQAIQNQSEGVLD